MVVEQTSEKVVMMGWMSAGKAANTGLLREREREDAREGDAAAGANTGRRRVDGHVELPEEVDAQDGPLYVCCDEGEVALMHG